MGIGAFGSEGRKKIKGKKWNRYVQTWREGKSLLSAESGLELSGEVERRTRRKEWVRRGRFLGVDGGWV